MIIQQVLQQCRHHSYGFEVDDEVTMSGAFSCASYTGGLTTSIFPEPQDLLSL